MQRFIRKRIVLYQKYKWFTLFCDSYSIIFISAVLAAKNFQGLLLFHLYTSSRIYLFFSWLPSCKNYSLFSCCQFKVDKIYSSCEWNSFIGPFNPYEYMSFSDIFGLLLCRLKFIFSWISFIVPLILVLLIWFYHLIEVDNRLWKKSWNLSCLDRNRI